MKKSANKFMYAIALGLATTIAVSIWYGSQEEYADIGIQLSANGFVSSGGILGVDLRTKNEGNLDVVPSFTVWVINATVFDVEIEDIQKHRLPDFCQMNETCVTISNFTITAGSSFSVLATIDVVPNEQASGFGVFSSATLPPDALHPKNRVLRTPPFEYVYELSNQGGYVLAD